MAITELGLFDSEYGSWTVSLLPIWVCASTEQSTGESVCTIASVLGIVIESPDCRDLCLVVERFIGPHIMAVD